MNKDNLAKLNLVYLWPVILCLSACGYQLSLSGYDSSPLSSSTADCLSASEIASYYRPTKGTLNLHYGAVPCEPPQLIGKPLPTALIVLNDVGQYIVRVEGDGTTSWLYRSPDYIFDLRLIKGDLQFIEKEDLVILDVATGVEKSRQNIGYARCYSKELVCIEEGILIRETGKIIPASYPRDAKIFNGKVYVADTFGFKVFAYDIATDTTVWSIDSYYPNSIQITQNGLLVTEEHANRVVEINLNTVEKTIVYGCSAAPFMDSTISASQIEEQELTGDLDSSDGKSVCAGGLNLYSPNGARLQPDGSLLISDTDNQRVLQISNSGEILRELINLNNPVRAIIVP